MNFTNMATEQSIIDYILDQLSGLEVRARKMFGEYALYCDDKVVALVCDNRLFIKPTPAGEKFAAGHFPEGHAYPGAKPSIMVDEEMLDDREWLMGLVRLTADALPAPKPKKKRIQK